MLYNNKRQQTRFINFCLQQSSWLLLQLLLSLLLLQCNLYANANTINIAHTHTHIYIQTEAFARLIANVGTQT